MFIPSVTFASGLTSDQVQAILGLLASFGADSATIANVKVSLTGGTPSTENLVWCHTFDRDLTVGSSGYDVIGLNQALRTSNIGTTDNSSSYDKNTANGVIAFQARYNIRQTGYVGPMTRAKLNALYGCRIGQTPPPAPVSASMSSKDPVIVSFDSNYTDQTGREVKITWQASEAADATLDVSCTPGYGGFVTDKGNHPTCDPDKSVWSWPAQANGSIIVTLTGTTPPGEIYFTLTLFKDGRPVTRERLYVTFQSAPTIDKPYLWDISSSFVAPGDSVTVFGSNLRDTAFTIDGVYLLGNATSSSSFTFNIPLNLKPGSHNVVAQKASGTLDTMMVSVKAAQ